MSREGMPAQRSTEGRAVGMARYGAPRGSLGDKAPESGDDGERKLEL